VDNSIVINATIQEQVYQIIRREVINRVYHEGEQLKEADLAQRFNVSRSPVREALHRLAGDGILTIIPNRGIFVKEFDEKYIIDVLDLRSLLEQRGISRSPEKLTPAIRAELQRMRGEMEEVLRTGDAGLDRHSALDTALHDLIMKLNDNTFISEISAKISALNSMFRYVSLSSDDRAMESQREHLEIIDALMAGDVEAAEQAYNRHIEGTKRRVVDTFVRRRREIIV